MRANSTAITDINLKINEMWMKLDSWHDELTQRAKVKDVRQLEYLRDYLEGNNS
jgi:anaerobic ribonucleoside-triphosphate reductase